MPFHFQGSGNRMATAASNDNKKARIYKPCIVAPTGIESESRDAEET
jgi:hypothetical protein